MIKIIQKKMLEIYTFNYDLKINNINKYHFDFYNLFIGLLPFIFIGFS